MLYAIKPFKHEVLCDISTLEVCDVLLSYPYMWKFHVVYESRTCSVIITLVKQHYRMPKVILKAIVSLVSAKLQSTCTFNDSLSKWTWGCSYLHGLFTWSLYTTELGGQSCGGIQGHLHLPYQSTFALPSEAFNWSNPCCAFTKWVDMQALCHRKWGN